MDDGLVRRLVGGAASGQEASTALTHLVTCATCRERIQQGGTVAKQLDALRNELMAAPVPPPEASTNALPPPTRAPGALPEPTEGPTRAVPQPIEGPPPAVPPPTEGPASAAPQPTEARTNLSLPPTEAPTKVERVSIKTEKATDDGHRGDPHPVPPKTGPAHLPLGSTVGRYLILHPVGQGGMGVVYAAYDPELDRKVALKLLGVSHDHIDDAQARLLREAQAMARVSHPNVTAVYDAGTYGTQVFLAMELIEGGKTLREWLLEKKRTWREILAVMVEAGRGLAAAHAAGLVHRDFKPDNVLVGRDGQVHVTDFGLARLAHTTEGDAGPLAIPPTPTPARQDKSDSNGAASPRSALFLPEPSSGTKDTSGARLGQQLTQVGVVVGTPSYMAPEQHLGKPPDTRSDQFSFCTTLYFALYQQHPFEPRKMAEAVRGASTVDPASLIKPPPKTPYVPIWVKRVLTRGLAISPDARFESMEALLARISRPPATTRWRWAATVAVVLVGAALLAQRELAVRRSLLCSGAEQSLRGAWDADSARRVKAAFEAIDKPYAAHTFEAIKTSLDGYARDWAAMHTDTCLATRVRGEQTEAVLTLRMTCLERRLKELQVLTEILSKADASTLEHAVEAVGGLPRVSTCANVEALSEPVPPPEDPLARAEVARLSSDVAQVKMLGVAAKYKAALERVEPLIEPARKLRYTPLLAEVLYQKGAMLRLLGRGKDAEQVLLEAWSLADIARTDEVRVQAATQLIGVFNSLESDLPEALRWGQLGDAALGRLARSPDLEIALRKSQGAALLAHGDYAKAREQLERALSLDAATNGERSTERPILMIHLSRVYQAQNELTQALRLTEEATALSERLYGPQHPYAGVGHHDTAELYRAQGDFARAEPHARKALAVLETTLGPQHPIVGMTCDTLANILAGEHRFGEASAYAQRSLAVFEKTLPPGHRGWASALDNLAYIYLETGRAKEALPLLERALALENLYPDVLAHARFHMARALVATGGDKARARTLATQALELHRAQHQKRELDEVERWMKSTFH